MKLRTRKTSKVSFKNPQEMYDDYKSRKIQGIHDYQSKMIDIYMDKAFEKENVALELPTGAGKTLIGLLFGEFRRRNNNEKVLYLCPTNQLVNQVADYAVNKFGIPVEKFTGKISEYSALSKINYNDRRSIAITNYSSLFNVNTFFRDADIIIFDDAHSAEGYISSNWTLEIQRDKNEELYFEVADILTNTMDSVDASRIYKENPTINDSSWVEMIPNLKIVEERYKLIQIIDKGVQNNNLRYSWSNICDNLHACNIFISHGSILIRPFIPPTLTLDAFKQAKQRIFMSATLGQSGELERIIGINNIFRLPMVKNWSNKSIGRKLFLFPNASFSENLVGTIIEKITEKVDRCLMIVKDNKTANEIEEYLKENTSVNVYTKNDLEFSKNKFINDENGFALLANRFDGLDFPDSECRMLILFDLPTATHLQEKFLITRLAAKHLFNERINTRIVQALGRCTRSQTDYSAVCIFGDELMNTLISNKHNSLLNPELKAEIKFGLDNSTDHKDVDDYLEILDIFYNKTSNSEWADAENDIYAFRDEYIEENNKIVNTEYEELINTARIEVDVQYLIWKKDFRNAISKIEVLLGKIQSKSLLGYKGYWYYTAGTLAYEIYKSGENQYKNIASEFFRNASNCSLSITWLNNLIEHDKQKEIVYPYMGDIISNFEIEMTRHSKHNRGKFQELIDCMIENMKSTNGETFEKGHKLLGSFLGFNSLNPKGDSEPDPYWSIGNRVCIVAEDKIFKSTEKPIPTRYVRQALTHKTWVVNKRICDDQSKIFTIFVSNSKFIESSAQGYSDGIYYVNQEELVELAVRVKDVLIELRRHFTEIGNLKWRERVFTMFVEQKITPTDLIKFLTKKKLIDLPIKDIKDE